MIKLILISIFLINLYGIDCNKRLFDINILKESSIYESLDELSKYCSFSIVIKDKISKEKLNQTQKSINIKQLNLEEVFNILIKENNLNYDFNGKVLKIYGLETKTFKIDYISSIREGQSIIKASVDAKPKQAEYSANDDLEDNTIKTLEKFDFWFSIKDDLMTLLNNNCENYEVKNIIINQNAGLITISATPNQLKRAKKYIQDLQKRLKKQVIIDVSIIAVNLNKTHSSGVNWQNFNMSLDSKINNYQYSFIQINNNTFVKNLSLKNTFNFEAILNFLSKNGKTHVLSNPKLMALNNQQAIISVGDTINYQIKESSKGTENGTTVSEFYNNYSIFVGILLNILPEISDDNKIMLRINPSLSDFKYPQDNIRQIKPRAIAPDTIQKKLSTVVEVENNQTIILGGLISKNNSKDENSVNFLSSIPIFGNLFKSSDDVLNSTEIIFIITPYIIENNKNIPSLKELGFKYHE